MSVSEVIADHGVHSIHPPHGDKWRDMKSLCMDVDNRDATKRTHVTDRVQVIRAFARVVAQHGIVYGSERSFHRDVFIDARATFRLSLESGNTSGETR
jgi:hypothetical protein